MVQSLSAYRYNDLPEGDVFRYLVLKPGGSKELLVCDLHTAPITETKFDALSYVWGKDDRDHTVVCNGKRMMITANLAAALRRIRQLDRSLTLWADGICINQQSIGDKNHQVARMGKIYRAAQRVLMYMGPDDDDYGPSLCSLVDDVDRMIQGALKAGTVSWRSLPYPEDDDDPILDQDRWESLYWLMSESWFSRGWVVQEAAVARQGQIIWGKTFIDWHKIMRTYIWMSTRAHEICHAVSFRDVNTDTHVMLYLHTNEEFGRAFCGDYMFETHSLLRILYYAKDLELKDPRDRIYAFISLPGEQVDITPDYHSSHQEAYRQFAIHHIESTKTVEILDYVSHDDDSFHAGCSWVPRWDIPIKPLSLNSSATSILLSRSMSQGPVTINDQYLSVRGVVLDVIEYASVTFGWETKDAVMRKIIKSIWDRVQSSTQESPYAASDGVPEHQLHTFLQALCGGSGSTLAPEWRQAREMYAVDAGLKPGSIRKDQIPTSSALQDRETSPELDHNSDDLIADDVTDGAEEGEPDDSDSDSDSDIEEDESNLFYRTMRTASWGRRMIITGRGYVGLAPGISREGDSIAIVFGCQNPSVLRWSNLESNHARSGEQMAKLLGSTSLLGKHGCDGEDEEGMFYPILGEEGNRDWVDWDVEEQDIHLC